MDTQLETLAAWIDGEPVSRTEVSRALESPEGRDYVLDLMALRRMVTVTTPHLTAVPVHRSRGRTVLAAAAAVLMCVAAGYGAGRLTTPSPVALPDAVVPVSSPATIAAPAPTRVIQLEESPTLRESGN